ncbi:MAG: hypothetical protein KGI58_02650 [Patescibacteria group bacterium]|nr:hypothetical protein [Patescibacteria group bacterium]
MKTINQKILKYINLQKGYALLFTVVIVSLLSLIGLGLSNSTYKQLVLSNLASDSQLAFYQSDTATECALYADIVKGMTPSTASPWYCGMDSTNTPMSFTVSSYGSNGSSYQVTSSLANNNTDIPCFDFNVTKTGNPSPAIGTIIDANGYNSCNKTSAKTVERTIQVSY